MPAAKYSFKVEQGATLTFNIEWRDNDNNPIDISGSYDSAKMQIRSDYADINGNTLYATLTSSLSASPSVTGLFLSSSGTINVFLSAETTERFTFEEGLYDLELYKGGVVERLLEGKVTVSKEVTRH
jgi:hypothetical protein